MNQIQVKVLNPESVKAAEKMMCAAGRLTQRGEKLSSVDDFMALYNKEYTPELVETFCSLPHPTIQKFGLINVVVVGASRRFLAQITRHQNEIKFMSASLQYSDYGSDNNKTDFVVPYTFIGDEEATKIYLDECKASFESYKKLVDKTGDNDAAGYVMTQGLRNVLIMSATPFQWKYMIGLRTCNRNTKETQYVLARIWEQLYDLSPEFFGKIQYGCLKGHCEEGKMSCKRPFKPGSTPKQVLEREFPKLVQ